MSDYEPAWIERFRTALRLRKLIGWRAEYEYDEDFGQDAVRLVGSHGERYDDLLYENALLDIDTHIIGAKLQFERTQKVGET